MRKKQTKLDFFKKIALPIVGVVLILLAAVILLWLGNANSLQSVPARPAQVYFTGDYRIGDGDWQEIKEGEHIPATKGDVTLRGNFHMLTPNGDPIGIFTGSTPIAFYTDHIHLTICEEGKTPYSFDCENPRIGVSACGVSWTTYKFSSGSTPIEIVIHNPHSFGNERAIDEMLSRVAFWATTDFENNILASGDLQRNTGIVFLIASIMFLGTALFSSLIHIKNSKIIWLLGLVTFFAGAYFMYGAIGVSFWSGSVVSNTTILGVSMMLYMFFLTLLVTFLLKGTKKVGAIASVVLGVAIMTFLILSMTTAVFFYDTWLYWTIVQGAVNLCLLVCLIKEAISAKGKEKVRYLIGVLPFVAFGVDAVATGLAIWQGGLVSRYVFVLLFIMAIVVVLRVIPRGINAMAKAKELEREKVVLDAQLKESRVSTMMSQIRPHFIYNTLGSIEQLCDIDPPKAGQLVHNFAKYLRGNFGELDNTKPILMSQEMEHVQYYVNIERVRFPDMQFIFEMYAPDFSIPALTVQPIVENAIKHGLMKLQKGGTIRVVSYMTDTHYCITVEDDGVGFDTSVLLDERAHIGIRNIRGRLQAMVDGTLEIDSKIGVGTKVMISIPKEGQK